MHVVIDFNGQTGRESLPGTHYYTLYIYDVCWRMLTYADVCMSLPGTHYYRYYIYHIYIPYIYYIYLYY